MRATHSKKVGTGRNKRPENLNVHIRNSWRTNLRLIRSIGNMIGYKKGLSEWQCLSEVKMGRGSPIPPMLRRKIVEQYQKGVSQRKIAKSLKLSSSTVHNIIQRFRESGTISVRKGQGRKTILDARDLRALRRHCITYRNATVMEITTWAQEYFQKTLSVNTIHRAIRRCRLKLYRSKKNMIQKRRRFLWAKAHLKQTVAKWKTVLWSDESKFEVLFGKLGRHVIRTKEDKDNPSWGSRSGFSLSQGPEEHDRPGSICNQSHRPSHQVFNVQPDSVGVPPLAHDNGDERGGQSSLPRRSGLVRQPFWTSCGGLCWTLHGDSEVVSGDATLNAPALPLLPVAPDLRPLSRQLNKRRNPPEQPGRKRRVPSLATAGPPRKQPLLCLSLPCLALGLEESVFMDPHGPTIAPRCPIAVIADKIKHIHFQKESKNLFLPTISVLPLCSQSVQPFQPLAMRAEAWQAIPGVSTWVMTTVRRGYTLQFAQRPPRFHGAFVTTVRSENAQVLRAEVMNLLEKGVIEIVLPAQSESGF